MKLLSLRSQAFHAEHERRLLSFALESFGAKDNQETARDTKETKEALKLPTDAKEAKEYVEHLIDESQKVLAEKVVPALKKADQRVSQALDPNVLKNLPAEKRQELQQMKQKLETSLAQLEAGGVLRYLKITIEHPKGSTRQMKMKDGSLRPVVQKNDYGRINGGRLAQDGEPYDVFLGPNTKTFNRIFRINQGDEPKDMVGFMTAKEAMDAYLANHPEKTAKDVPPPTEMTIPEFQKMFGVGTLAA